MATATNLGRERVKFTKFHIRGIKLDVGSIISMDIYETIDFPGITGTLAYKDIGDVKESFDIIGKDTFDISFGREGESELKLKMSVNEAGGDRYNDDDGDIGNTIIFGFCSPWLIDGFTKKRTRHFRNQRIDQIVQTLLLDSGAILGTITETSQTLDRYVTPYISPIASIQHLMEIATDTSGNGGYILYTDIKTNRVNFVPIGSLISKPNRVSNFNLRISPVNSEYKGRVYDFQIDQQYDIMKYGQLGMAHTRFVGFNYDRTEIMNTNKRVDTYSDNHLSVVLPLNEEFLGRQYRTTKDSSRFPNTAGLIRSKADASNQIDGRLASFYNNFTADAIEITVTARGEVSAKRAGKLIKLDVPNVGGSKKNFMHSGTYLIKRIKHTIQGGEHGQKISLIADGYKQINRDTLISWQAGRNSFTNGDSFDVDSATEAGN